MQREINILDLILPIAGHAPGIFLNLLPFFSHFSFLNLAHCSHFCYYYHYDYANLHLQSNNSLNSLNRVRSVVPGINQSIFISNGGDRFISLSQSSSIANPSKWYVHNGMKRMVVVCRVVWTMKLKFNLLQRGNEWTLREREQKGRRRLDRRRRRDICTNTFRIKTTDEDSVFPINWMVNRRTWSRLWPSLNLDKRRLKDLHPLLVSNWFSQSMRIISIGLLQLIYSLQSHPLLPIFARFANGQSNSNDYQQIQWHKQFDFTWECPTEVGHMQSSWLLIEQIHYSYRILTVHNRVLSMV